MGWPSTEKELEAWSPRPWKRPLESAATPGDVVGDERAERRGLALERQLVEEAAVDVGVKGGVVFDEVARSAGLDCHRLAGDRRFEVIG